jgi:PBSX family phage terminase large subunit
VQIAPLTGKALQAVKLSTARINAYEGAVRSSKTISSLLAWLKFVREGPPGPLLMVGKTERTLRHNIIDPLVDMLGPARCRLVAGSGEVWLLGRRVYLAGAHNEGSVDKIRGLTLVGLYIDEAPTVPQSFWVMALTRLSLPASRAYLTANPEGSQHWLKRDYLDRAALHLTRDGQVINPGHDDPLDLHRFSFQLADNPNLTREYIRSLELENTGLWRRRLILGEWCLSSGAIYDAFSEDRHVVDILPPIVQWLALGIDHGTVNPLHAVLLGLGHDGCLYVTSEWRYDSKLEHRQLSDHEYSERLRDWLANVPVPGAADLRGVHPQWVVVDPSAAGFRVQLYRDGWSPALANNDVGDGIRSVASLLATDRLKIHRSCRELIRELPSYEWDDAAAQKGEDKPVKVADHGADALRYAIHTTQATWRHQLREPAEAGREAA